MAIAVNDRVQIIKAPQDQPGLLNQTGQVVMITDDVNCAVQLDNGAAATVTADQLKKIS